jgi:hypothetical protein
LAHSPKSASQSSWAVGQKALQTIKALRSICGAALWRDVQSRFIHVSSSVVVAEQLLMAHVLLSDD